MKLNIYSLSICILILVCVTAVKVFKIEENRYNLLQMGTFQMRNPKLVTRILTMDQIEKKEVVLVLYIRANCPYCRKVLESLKGMHKTIVIKDIGNNAQYAQQLVQIGGKQQVPCLVINGKPLYESNDIIEWLENH